MYPYDDLEEDQPLNPELTRAPTAAGAGATTETPAPTAVGAPAQSAPPSSKTYTNLQSFLAENPNSSLAGSVDANIGGTIGNLQDQYNAQKTTWANANRAAIDTYHGNVDAAYQAWLAAEAAKVAPSGESFTQALEDWQSGKLPNQPNLWGERFTPPDKPNLPRFTPSADLLGQEAGVQQTIAELGTQSGRASTLGKQFGASGGYTAGEGELDALLLGAQAPGMAQTEQGKYGNILTALGKGGGESPDLSYDPSGGRTYGEIAGIAGGASPLPPPPPPLTPEQKAEQERRRRANIEVHTERAGDY